MLRDELLRARARNQELRVRLAEERAPRRLVRSLVGAGRRTAKRIVLSHVPWKTKVRYGNDFDPSFRPYSVRSPAIGEGTRMRVVHAIGHLGLGGSARLVVDLVERLGQEHAHLVLTRDDPRARAYVGLPVAAYPDLISPRRVVRRLRDFRPDLVHIHYLADHAKAWSDQDSQWYVHIFRAAEEIGCPVVENVNVPTDPYVSNIVASYVYVSRYVLRRFGRPGDPNTVIYPGSDLRMFARRSEWRPDGAIGLVYRLQADKLSASSIAPILGALDRRPSARALVVGGGALLPEFRSAAEQRKVTDRITFSRYVPYERLPELYDAMAIFVAPVHSESFGQVSTFAMGMELPVVAYAIGALPEIVGGPEVLTAAGDHDALANLITELLDEPDRAREIGRRNRDRARALFSVETMIARYAELYDSVLANATRRFT
jgi:glycosyltransferase involved in cell wall biosynthesis